MKEALMADMFNRIAPRYDYLNRLLSFRRDVYWRKMLVRHLPQKEKLHIIDLATGTGDLAIAICQHSPHVVLVEGVDVAEQMIKIGKQKIDSLGLGSRIQMHKASASALPFASSIFDAATVAFGVRNFSELDVSMKEMVRVLKPGGRALVLEFSIPKNAIVRFFYLIYFRYILPKVGAWFSSDANAYHYLNQSVEAFQSNERFAECMSLNGLNVILEKPMTCGVVTLYVGEKR